MIVIDLLARSGPQGTWRQIVALAQIWRQYDNVVFHRVIEGFMAQTGDVQYGKMGGDTDLMAGRNGRV